MGEFLIIPSPAGDNYAELSAVPVALARSRKVQGRLFRKHILNMGPLIHPKTGAKIDVNEPFVAAMQNNFKAGVCDIVQVPLANAKNEHTEAPVDNLGEVVGIEREGSKVYALIDARKDAENFGKTYLGASAFLSTDYTDTRTGQKAGPTLLHVAVTNRPYVTGLDDYQEVVAATADGVTEEAVVLTPEEGAMPTKEEMLAALRDEHGIDVEALQRQATQAGDVSQLTSAIAGALSGNAGLQLSADSGITGEDLVGAISELATLSRSQGEEIGRLQRREAETEVDGYVSTGRLLPKSRNRAVEMVLSGDRDGLADFLAPEKEPYVKLSAQSGVTGDTDEGHVKDVDTEVSRIAALSRSSHMFEPNSNGKAR